MDDPKKDLFLKFIHDACSPEEVAQLLEYLQNSADDTTYKALMDEVWLKLKAYPPVNQAKKEQQFEIILDRSRRERQIDTKVRPLSGKYSMQIAAACIGLLMVSSLVYFLFFQSSVVTYQTGFGETR